MAIQPLPKPLAERAAGLAVQAVGGQQLEARGERRRARTQLADRGGGRAFLP
jgi:hypothetical protein